MKLRYYQLEELKHQPLQKQQMSLFSNGVRFAIRKVRQLRARLFQKYFAGKSGQPIPSICNKPEWKRVSDERGITILLLKFFVTSHGT